jgi:xanthine dehydrogenase YagS FAD-binding subunit
MRLGISAPARLLDIGHLAELDRIEPLPGGGLKIGALVRLADLGRDATIARDYRVLSQAVRSAASAQLRNLATIGGNLLQKTRCPYFRAEETLPCNKRAPGSGCAAREGLNEMHAIFGWSDACVATQPSDPAVALAALDAVVLTESRDGPRRIPAREFHTLPGDTPDRDNVLHPGDLIVGIELGAPAPRSAYLKLRERESYEFATVSAAVTIETDGEIIRAARIALGSVAHRPWRLDKAEAALGRKRIGSDDARTALDAAFAEARPLAHNAHKVTLARNAALRALAMAAEATP